MAMDLETMLLREGCEVIELVPSIERALLILEAERPDAVLLDLNLHGESSTAVAARLNDRKIPFVVVSGYAGSSMNDPALQNAPLVGKPPTPAELTRRLSEVLHS